MLHRATLGTCFVVVSAGVVSHARADEDLRGPRGFFVGAGPGFVIGRSVDADGRDTPSYFGSGGWFRFGEEVLEDFTLGLEIGGVGGTGEDFAAGIGGFVLQGTWRPSFAGEGLVLLLGTGVGGGSLTPDDPDDDAQPEGSGGGALFELGAHWELDLFGRDDEGFVFGPALHAYLAPETADNPVRFTIFTVGLESAWYFGR